MTGVSTTSWRAPRSGVAAFSLTPRALKDLDAIADYSLDRWGRDRTRDYLDALAQRMQWLADNPDLGRKRNDVAKGYRCFGEGQHLVFYVERDDDIAIIGVPHASMDIETHLRRP